MSRMNGYVGLNPQARPVDAYAAPNVPSPVAWNDGLRLANALASVNPAIQPIMDRQFEAYKRSSEMRATKDVLDRRLDNMTKFKEAVSKGEIPWADNPWSMAQAEKEVAQAQARTMGAGFDQVLEENPEVRFGNDPQAVASLWDKHFSEFSQGLTPFAAEAALPELQGMKNRVLFGWANQRGQEREVERETASKNAYVSMFTSGSLFDNEQASIEQTQGILDASLRTVDAKTANRWLLESLHEAAVLKGDANLPGRILSQLKGNGGASLADTAAARAMQLRTSLNVSTETLRQTRERSALRNEQSTLWKAQMGDLMVAQMAANPAITPSTWSPAKDAKEAWESAPPGAQLDWIKEQLGVSSSMHTAVNQERAEAGRGLVDQAVKDFNSGMPRMAVISKYQTEAIAMGSDTQLKQAMADLESNVKASPSHLERTMELDRLDARNELSAPLVYGLYKKGLLTLDEAESYGRKAALIKTDPYVEKVLDNGKAMIRVALTSESKIASETAGLFGVPFSKVAEEAALDAEHQFISWRASQKDRVNAADAQQYMDGLVKLAIERHKQSNPSSSSTAPEFGNKGK